MNFDTIYEVIRTEAFISIHMSVFVFIPMSIMLSRKHYKELFLLMFTIRAAILFYFDAIGEYWIADLDFYAVFLGAFVINPIVFFATKSYEKLFLNRIIRDDEKQNNKNVSGDFLESDNLDGHNYIDNTNGDYVDSDRYLNSPDDDLKIEHSSSSKVIQKCDVCGKKSELSYSYCPYCGAFLLGDIVDETEK